MIPKHLDLTQPFKCCGVLCSAYVFYGTKCPSRLGERQGQLAWAVDGQGGVHRHVGVAMARVEAEMVVLERKEMLQGS